MPFSLSGRRALVTGASQGIGWKTSRLLAECGADVAMVFLRRADAQAESAEVALQEVKQNGRGNKAILIEADVTNENDIERVKGEIVRQFGGLDILVNGAAGFPTRPKSLVEMSNEDWDRSIDLNLRSVFLSCRIFGRMMRDQNYGRIINFSSGGAAFGLVEQAHYCASKAGIVAMTKVLARELGPYGITCNLVTPGRIDTPMSRKGVEEKWWADPPESIFPLGRCGKPEDVAGAVCYFASDEASWVTGQVLHVNGGSFMF